ncbi:hypothetical protein MSAN_01909200 [Mycena sanguinolenta]|uniref:DUF6534 domain-containing protein n=1 Tax=Mycena sanguinolenta TaxID=230812 RepID=A0A8H6XPY6_9AGAR|nr:hypothetical protein MSAN_01909200 [Mycena sanguinolenta]
MCGDLLLTAGTVFSLFHHSKVALPRGQTAQMLKALLRLTIQSAAPGAACGLINFVTAVRWNHATSDYPALMLSQISNMLLPNLYSISAMWTLNTRAEIRGILETDPTLHTLHIAAASTDTSGHDTERDLPDSTQSVKDEKLQLESENPELWAV